MCFCCARYWLCTFKIALVEFNEQVIHCKVKFRGKQQRKASGVWHLGIFQSEKKEGTLFSWINENTVAFYLTIVSEFIAFCSTALFRGVLPASSSAWWPINTNRFDGRKKPPGARTSSTFYHQSTSVETFNVLFTVCMVHHFNALIIWSDVNDFTYSNEVILLLGRDQKWKAQVRDALSFADCV